jgi:hypothetical protein
MNTVNKVALVPLSKLMQMRKRLASCDTDTLSDGPSIVKQQKLSVEPSIGGDSNLEKAQKLKEVIIQTANDESSGVDQKLQKYLSAIREYVLFRNKGRTVSHLQKPNIITQMKTQEKSEISQGDDQSHEMVSPTRPVVMDENDKNILKGLRGVSKTRGQGLLNDLKSNPHFSWSERGTVTIKDENFPGSDIGELVRYEIEKYSKKRQNQIPPRNYNEFFSFLKSQNISPHKTSRETRQLVVDESQPSTSTATESVRKELKFEESGETGESLKGKGFSSHYWHTY